MSGDQHTDTSSAGETDTLETEDERTHVAILNELDPIHVLEALPRTVFPVTATVCLRRTQSGDTPHDAFQNSTHPVPVRDPVPTPYIPETTIYFDNPAERPPDHKKAWTAHDCLNELDGIMSYLDAETDTDSDRFELTGLCVVEIPARFLTTDHGRHVATPALYDAEGEMTLAYFQKEASLLAHGVRDELGDALPGEARSPLQLVRLDEVTAKPSRSARETTQQAGRCQYYTAAEAEKYNELAYTPAVWQPQRLDASSRPLEVALSDLDEFLPMFATSDLVEQITFKGKTRSRERFYADELLTR